MNQTNRQNGWKKRWTSRALSGVLALAMVVTQFSGGLTAYADESAAGSSGAAAAAVSASAEPTPTASPAAGTPAPSAAATAAPTASAAASAAASPSAGTPAPTAAASAAPTASAAASAVSSASPAPSAGSTGSGIGNFFAQLFGAPAPAAGYTATVTNTAYNYAADGKVTYTLDKAAAVTIGGTEQTVAAGGSFTVPADTASFTVTGTDTPATVTLDAAATGCLLLSAASQTLADGGTAAFISQQPLENVSLYKEWRDGALSSKATDGMALGLQFSRDGGTTWTDLSEANKADLGYTALPAVPQPAAESNASAWKYDFTQTLAGFDAAGNAVSYRLAETAVPAGYAASYLSVDGVTTLCNTLKKPYSATVKWLDASDAYHTRISTAAWAAGLSITRSTILSEDAAVSASTDPNDEFYVAVTDNGDGTWTVSMPNALAFDSRDFAYTYSLQQQAPVAAAASSTAPAGSTYEPAYSNVDTHASNAGALFSGGTVTDKLTNTTQFSATKKWMDDGAAATIAARPQATITLYRYAKGRGSYTTASPVSLPGAVLSDVPVRSDAASGEEITLTLPAAAGESLPLFDEDGYQYVYFVKETLKGGTNTYAQVFDNSASGDFGEPASGQSDTARYLFNGGTLNNTITGTVDLAATKQWIAAARQDVDAQVTMTVDRSNPGDGTGTPVTEQNVASAVLQGFGAEITAQTANFGSLPEYNSYGRKYTYSVRESAVSTKVGDSFAAAEEKTADGNNYIVTADGYRYLQQSTTDAAGNITVRNVLVGNAQVIIQKTFTDGLLADTTLHYSIYRNGTKIGEKTVTYSQAEHPEVPFVPDVLTLTQYSDFDAGTAPAGAAGLLPRYDDSGAEYSYTVAETGITSSAAYGHTDLNAKGEAVYADGAFAGEHYLTDTASINNYKPGEGASVSVYKNWVDAGDELYHSTVAFALQYNAGTAAAPDWVVVRTGSIPTSTHYTYVSITGTAADGVSYAAHYNTWADAGKHADVPGAFRVVETSLGSSPVVLHAAVDAAAHPEHEQTSVTVNGVAGNWSFVSTPNQNYDVSPEAACDEAHEGRSWTFTLTNKRVGVEKIQLTKVWKDGSDQNGARPASISFTVTASEAVFDGSTTKEFTVAGNADTWTLDTGWLTKYDASGAVIRYDIAESEATKTALAAQNYASSSEHVGYAVGPHHTGDVDTYRFTNQLSGSVVPYMNKVWMDTGTAEQASLRPDIYPVLLRSYTDAAGSVHYEKMKFTERDWNTNRITQNWWTCTFVPQERYNADGFEYTYYVGEEFTTKNLNDYVCAGSYTNEPDAAGSFTQTAAYAFAPITLTTNGVTETFSVARLDNTTRTAGTIVNLPRAMRTVSGSKQWVNLPREFSKGYLPAVTFQLYRCTYDSYQANGDKYAEKVLQSYDAAGNAVAQPNGILTTMPSGSSSFAFAGNYPKYDETGKPYYYVVREVAPQKMDVVYTITNDPVAGLVVKNSYNDNQNFAVTFTKSWTTEHSITDYVKKPGFTFTLVRYLTNADGSAIAGTRETAFATAAGNNSSNAVTLTYDNNDADTILWNNLAYYGPNGRPYQYRVEETGVPNGWIAEADGKALSAAKLDSGAAGYSAAVSGSYYDALNQGAGTAALGNHYGKVLGSIQLQKAWSGDAAYAVSARPGSVLLVLARTADGSTETVGTYTLTADNNWAMNVSGLEIYAPSGSLYTYTVHEATVPEGYTAAVSPAAGVNAAADGAALPVLKATNTAQNTSLTIRKDWAMSAAAYEDDALGTNTAARLLFEANLSGVPATILYHVAYSTDDGATWQVLKKGNAAASWTVTAAKGSYANVTAGSLPAKIWENGELKSVRYTAYEYSVTWGGKLYTRTEDAPGAVSFGSMTSSEAVLNGTTAAITNTVPLRKITITKNWDDQKNRDGLRAALTFTITRTGVNSATDTDTAEVTLSEKNAVSDDQWSASYYVPLWRNDTAEAMSSYTVTESKGVSTEYTSAGSADGSTWTNAAKPVVALESTEADTTAWFRNTKTSADTFTLQASKQWLYNGSALTANALTEYSRYFPASIVFTLEYSLDGTTWKTADNDLLTGITAEQTAAVDAAAGTVVPAAWANLPKAQYTGSVDTQKPYYYRVRETVTGPFAAAYATNVSGTTWTAGSEIRGTAVTAKGTATVRASNSLQLTSLTISKTWNDTKDLYGTRPDAVLYQIEYSENGTDWSSVPAAWLEGGANPVRAAKAQAYGAVLSRLPQYAPDGSLYQYRAAETGLVYGSTTVTPGAGALYQSATADGKAFVNTLDTTSFSFEKVWGSDAAGIHSAVTAVIVRLQRTTSAAPTESDWADVTYSGGTEWQIDQNNGAFARTWSDLPARDTAGSSYTYRAVEAALLVKSGSTTVRADAAGTAQQGTVGGFAYTAVTVNDGTTHKTTVTNTPVTGSLKVTKAWNDENDRDGIRPDSIAVTLTAGSTLFPALSLSPLATSVQLRADTSPAWEYAWSDVPVMDAAGNAITYTLTEAGTAGYTAAYAVTGGASGSGAAASAALTAGQQTAAAFTNTHTPAVMSITAGKVWTGDVAADRPASLRFTLQSSQDGTQWTDVETRTAAVAAATGACSCTWQDLPVFLTGASGTALHYRVTEAAVNGYTSAWSAQDFTGSALAAANAGANAQTATVTNTMIPSSLTVNKTWADTYQLNASVQQMVFQLQRKTASGTEWTNYLAPQKVERSAGSYTWNGLPSCDAAGRALQYRAAETGLVLANGTAVAAAGDALAGTVGGWRYAASTQGTAGIWTTAVTNTVMTGALAVSKTWDDDSDREKVRPLTLSVGLSAAANGSAVALTGVAASAELNAANGWADSTTWAVVPVKDAAGNAITYTLTEASASGYTPSYVISGGATGRGYTAAAPAQTAEGRTTTVAFTNTHGKTTLTVTASKVWADNNQYQDRPASVEFTLYASYPDAAGKTVKEAVTADDAGQAVTNPARLTSANQNAADADQWDISWKDLPLFKAGLVGSRITYTVEETPVAGYDAATSGTVITNTMQETALTVHKAWGADAAAEAQDVSAITYALQRRAAGSTDWSTIAVQTVARGQDDSFSHAWASLPQYSSTGSLYAYRAVEQSLTKGGTELTLTAVGGSGETGYISTFFTASAVTTGSGAGGFVTTVTNDRTQADFRFAKTGTNDEVDLTSAAPLAGAVFGLYADAACAAAPVQTVTSDSTGTVCFVKIPCGTFYIREISAPDNYTASTEIYPVTVDEKGKVSCEKLAESTPTDTVVDEAVRGSFTMTKVDETDPAHRIAGTTYSLFKKAAGRSRGSAAAPAGYVWVEDGVTGADGAVTFDNLLIGTDYLIRETKAPAGYQMSEKPISVTFALAPNGQQALVQLTDNGGGTVRQNADGSFTWLEPPTRVSIRKQDSSGALLVGAQLRIVDASGNVVDSWTSDGTEHLLSGVLTVGASYTLQETAAPAGYDTAAAVTFTVEPQTQASNVLYTQTVSMTDTETPPAAAGPRTGDSTPLRGLLAVQACALGALLLAEKRKRARRTK